ncbi:MAG: hypothetical protein RL722_2579 [Pseudomonadota bacterium]|jgi:phenol hydroxylase P0 protein
MTSTLLPATSPDAAPDQPAELPGDVMRKFVRVIERRPNGLVAFEFAIGWPDLAAELVLPAPIFEAFCERHGAERLPDELRTPGAPARPPDTPDEDVAGG